MPLPLQALYESNPDALAKLREHAREEQPCESVGLFIFRAAEPQTLLRYERLANLVADPDNDVWSIAEGWAAGIRADEFGVLVHSHTLTPPRVSLGDMQGAHLSWFGTPYAIYSVPLDDLAVYYLTPGLNFPTAYVRVGKIAPE